MKQIFVLVLISCLLFSCATTKKHAIPVTGTQETISPGSTVSGDGSSFDNAIIINEKSETKGVDAEYAWLKKNYPGYAMISQSLSTHNGKSYDVLNIKTADGTVKAIYFDITNFFGKF